MNNKSVISGIEIKANLTVDNSTFKTCMNLISIYAKNKEMKGMVVRFNDDYFDTYDLRPLMTDEEVDTALYGSILKGE